MFSRLFATAQLFVALLLALLLGAVRTTRFLVKAPLHRLRVARRMLRTRALDGYAVSSPLIPVSEGLYRIDPAFLNSEPASEPAGPIVIYFTGTGETPHAPMPAYRRMIEAHSGLSSLRHYVVEAPVTRGAYYGSSAFSSRMWERVLPLFRSEPGPFVLVGLSRGAMAALDTGARIAEEHAKVAAVLAISPPFKVPARMPDSIVEVAAMEPLVERIAECLPAAPRPVQRVVEWAVRRVHIVLTAVIHAELDMGGEDDFAYAVHDIHTLGASQSSVRAVREFRLLVEAPDRELEHFVSRVAAAAARTPRFFAAFVWGEQDAWTPAGECLARLERALAREQTPADRVTTVMLSGRGHGLFRERAHPVLPIAELLGRTQREAVARAQAAAVKSDRERVFQQRLRASQHPPDTHHD